MKDEAVIIGGELQNEVYGDFTGGNEYINRVFLEVLCEGDANERNFTFPIPTYNITKNFQWDDPELKKTVGDDCQIRYSLFC